MDIIGNNIANVNTIGFKRGRVTFEEVFATTLRNAVRPSEGLGGINPIQLGLGTNIGSIDSHRHVEAIFDQETQDVALDPEVEGDHR